MRRRVASTALAATLLLGISTGFAPAQAPGARSAAACTGNVSAPRVRHGEVLMEAVIRCGHRKVARATTAYEVYVLASGKRLISDAGGGDAIGPVFRESDQRSCGWFPMQDLGTPSDRPVALAFLMKVHKHKFRRGGGPGRAIYQKRSRPVSFASLCPDVAAEWKREMGNATP